MGSGESLYSSPLLGGAAVALVKSARPLPVPARRFGTAPGLVGRETLFPKLSGSLQGVIQKVPTLLQWAPLVSLRDTLKAVGTPYVSDKK